LLLFGGGAAGRFFDTTVDCFFDALPPFFLFRPALSES